MTPRARLHTHSLMDELADMQREIRRLQRGIGVMQDYTPTFGSTAGAPTGWTTSGFYSQIGNMIFFEATFVAATGFTAGGGIYLFGLPAVPANTTIEAIGLGAITNSNFNYIAMVTGDTQACRLMRPALTTGEGAAGPYGNAWATNNTVRITGRYRV